METIVNIQLKRLIMLTINIFTEAHILQNLQNKQLLWETDYMTNIISKQSELFISSGWLRRSNSHLFTQVRLLISRVIVGFPNTNSQNVPKMCQQMHIEPYLIKVDFYADWFTSFLNIVKIPSKSGGYRHGTTSSISSILFIGQNVYLN